MMRPGEVGWAHLTGTFVLRMPGRDGRHRLIRTDPAPPTTPEDRAMLLDHAYVDLGDEPMAAARLHIMSSSMVAICRLIPRDWLLPKMTFKGLTITVKEGPGSGAWWLPDSHEMKLSGGPLAPYLFTHELGHGIDTWLSQRTLNRYGDPRCYASQEDTVLRSLVEDLRQQQRPVAARIAALSLRKAMFVVPEQVRRAILAGGLDLKSAVKLAGIFDHVEVERTIESAMSCRHPFSGGLDSFSFRSSLPSPLRVNDIAALQLFVSMLPVGVPLSMYKHSQNERDLYLSTLDPEIVLARTRGYYLSGTELFARAFDQVIHYRAMLAHRPIGPRSRPGWLPKSEEPGLDERLTRTLGSIMGIDIPLPELSSS